MFQILQPKLQPYMKQEIPDVQAGFRKGRGTRDQTANTHWIMEKARELQKNIYFCFIDYTKVFPLWITANHGKFLKRQEYQIILHVCWETWMQIKKKQNWTRDNGLVQTSKMSILRLYIFTLLIWRIHHTKYRLDDSQARIKIARRNIYNLRYANDTTPRAASEEETKKPLHVGERG